MNRGVDFIKKISKIEPCLPVIPKRKKTAAYARVSRDTERLFNSISAQISYYNALIQKNPEWEYAGVYADCGVTGTLTSKRSEFQRMLADCEAGKIDIIITKSISRFARNTVDLLKTIRHLKMLHIEVRFEKEQINSLSDDGELMLSLLASFAQEESCSISENVKWGIRKRFESGEIGIANKHIMGYQYDEKQKKYMILPEEAEIVRQIFDKYLQGISLRKIAKTLNGTGLSTIKGCRFSEASLNAIIHNEIYAGDIKRQKYFIENPITKRKIKNQGQLPQYYMPDCHEAILDRETWEQVQKEMVRRSNRNNIDHCFTGKIRCGICGNLFTRKKSSYKKNTYIYWICCAKKKPDITCVNVNFKEKELKQIAAKALGLKEFKEEEFKKQINTITVQNDGSLQFHFFDRRIEQWQRM